MDIKLKIYGIRTWKKTFISRHILRIALPVRRNSHHKSLDCCLSHFRTPISTSSPSAKLLLRFSTQLWAALRDKHFQIWTGNISLWISFALGPFAYKKTPKRTMLFGSILLVHGNLFHYRNQPLNMRVYYLGCHEAGLCCYLVIHRKPVTFFTAVLLLFVSYLLTLPINIATRNNLRTNTVMPIRFKTTETKTLVIQSEGSKPPPHISVHYFHYQNSVCILCAPHPDHTPNLSHLPTFHYPSNKHTAPPLPTL
jgi:hypothetical protein